MDEELSKVKSMLRSIVVSSATQMDVRSLVRDYRNLIGSPLPIARYGYRDPVAFLRERCSDCFLFQGVPSNPVLTLIVPDSLKHIDKFVQKQKVPSTAKFKGKRRSVMAPPETALIASTFKERKPKYGPPHTIHKITNKPENTTNTNHPTKLSNNTEHTTKIVENNNNTTEASKRVDRNGDTSSNEGDFRSRQSNFTKKKLSMCNSSQYLASEKSNKSSKEDADSGHPTVSCSSSVKMTQFSKLQEEIKELLSQYPRGILCSELITLYRDRYKRELNFSRFGFTSIISLACGLEDDTLRLRTEDGECVLSLGNEPQPASASASASQAPRQLKYLPVTVCSVQRPGLDPDEALPGIEFDPEVYPADCMHFMDSIASLSLEGIERGSLLEVVVGEVYSPSHFWLLRLGQQYNIAMDNMMDDMNEYYNTGAGRERQLSAGAVRVGQYCASVWEGDWHRSLIVSVIDADSVKVRHIDYGTVDRVPAGSLKPLLRGWSSLRAQAVRARLARVAPPARGRQWPRAAAAAFLRAVTGLKLVADVLAKDAEEDILEVFLIDTSTAEDVCIGTALCHAGHAEPRPPPRAPPRAPHLSECYQFPRFAALEWGLTPNYAELASYLRDGIALECVPEYRAHVPAALPDVLPDLLPDVLPAGQPATLPAWLPGTLLDADSPQLSTSSSDAEPASSITSTSSEPPRNATPSPFTISPRITTPPPTPASVAKSVQTTPQSPPNRQNQSLSSSQMYLCPYPPMQLYPQPVPMFGPPPANFVPIGPPFQGPIPMSQFQRPRFESQGRFYAPPQQSFPRNDVQRPAVDPFSRPPMPCPSSEVKLTVSECEVYRLLTQVDEHAAHCYMMDALRRAMPAPSPAAAPSPAPAPARLNPHAAEFRLPHPAYGYHHPPPGFRK